MSSSKNSPRFTISRLTTIEAYHEAEELQAVIWGMTDPLEVVPLHLLLTAHKNGGLVLGAFNEEGAMIGFLFGFLGRTPDGRLKHCSHMMGVHPEYRSQGIGYALKCAQRDAVLEQGLDLVTWTYDPLEGANAYLNLHRLGAIARTYTRNLYGAMMDALNQGLPSDRLEVEWWVSSKHVRARIDAGETPPSYQEVREAGGVPINRTEVTAAGLLAPVDWRLPGEAELLLLEIPERFQTIKRADFELARTWRFHIREVMEACFAAGYIAVDLLRAVQDGLRRNFYLLEREDRCVPALQPA